MNRTGSHDPRPHRPVRGGRPSAVRPPAGHPAGARRRRPRPRRRRRRRPVQLAPWRCWPGWSPSVWRAARPARCSPSARCRSTASRTLPGRSGAGGRRHRAGHAAAAGRRRRRPRRGSPGCPRSRRSRSPAAGRTPSWSPSWSGCRSPSSASPGRRSLVDADGVLFDTVTGAPAGGRRAARRGRRRARRTRPRCAGAGRGRARCRPTLREQVAVGRRDRSRGHHADPRPTAPLVRWGGAEQSDREGRGARRRCSSRSPSDEAGHPSRRRSSRRARLLR